MAGGELVTTLADVLAAHQRKQWGQHDGWWECECGEPYTPEHQAEAVAAAGLVVIQLPEPYPDETVHPYWSVEDVNGPQIVGVTESDDESNDDWVSIEFTARSRIVDAPTARALGTAFLAAANAAEAVSS